MAKAGRAAVVYFLAVFAVGFLLGTIRVLLVAPRLGDFRAVLLELPLMLGASWFASGWAMARFEIGGSRAGLAMGVGAFALLMLAEWALSRVMLGPTRYLSTFATPEGVIGLVGQVAFGLIPWIRISVQPR